MLLASGLELHWAGRWRHRRGCCRSLGCGAAAKATPELRAVLAGGAALQAQARQDNREGRSSQAGGAVVWRASEATGMCGAARSNQQQQLLHPGSPALRTLSER